MEGMTLRVENMAQILQIMQLLIGKLRIVKT